MAWVTEHHPDPAGLEACVQCGLCLPECPTFRLTGKETASPRGRLQAMSAVAAGVVAVDSKFEEIIGFCLGCRACEPVCPGMVPYGSLLEGARAEIVAQRRSPGKWLRGLLVGRLVGSSFFLGLATFSMRLLQTLRLDRIAPRRFRRALTGLRPLRSRSKLPATGAGSGATVGLLTGCIQEQWFPDVNRAAALLLGYAGFQVETPAEQTCCGALAAHDGHADYSHELVEQNRKAFTAVDTVVATAAGCSAHLADNLHNSADVTVIVADAISRGLLPRLPARNASVVVQDPCHLRHAQRITDAPRDIVRAAGYSVVDLDDSGMCCGAAGLYTVLQPEASAELGEKKARLIQATGEYRVVSANPGCEMQLRASLGSGYQISHPIELYLEALEGSDSATIVPRVESQT